jgi:restriction system protein
MGRNRGRSGLDTLAALPWPVGLAAGIAGFIAVRYGFVWWMSGHGGLLAQGFKQREGAMLAPLAWLLLAVCWIAALISFSRSRQRRRLLDTRTDLESLSQGGWRQFERLVGEAFRRQGYAVEETGLGGADGGIDLILRKDGGRTLVQCKQWKRQQVGVSVVREMAGLLAHHQAQAVKIVCIGTYTKDAERFAQHKPIELLSGAQLLEIIRGLQRAPVVQPMQSPRIEPALATFAFFATLKQSCPSYGSALVQRNNRHTADSFLWMQPVPTLQGNRRS